MTRGSTCSIQQTTLNLVGQDDGPGPESESGRQRCTLRSPKSDDIRFGKELASSSSHAGGTFLLSNRRFPSPHVAGNIFIQSSSTRSLASESWIRSALRRTYGLRLSSSLGHLTIPKTSPPTSLDLHHSFSVSVFDNTNLEALLMFAHLSSQPILV